MSKDLIIAMLALAFAGCAAAFLVTLAKLQEEKERRWDEISRAVGLEKIVEEYVEEKERYENNMSYADKTLVRLTNQNGALQDRLSSLLCPWNDHIWVGGVCKRCGRVQDAKLD